MSPSLFRLQVWTFKNRLLARLRRLRQVRYLAATIAGAAYIFFVWRPWRILRLMETAGRERLAAQTDLLASAEVGLGALFTAVVLLRWLWPGSKPVLDFSEAEVAFLFPAPLSRRQLVRYSLMKSQLGILFSVFMLTLIGLRSVAPSFLFAFLAVWIGFSTMQLHFLASTIVRSNLLAHGRAGLRRSWPVLAAGVVILILIGAWAAGWLRPPRSGELSEPWRYATEMLSAGPMGWLILPGRLLVRPAFATDLGAFLKLILPALVLFGLNYLWVIRSDFGFEEASAERAARRAAERAEKAATGRSRTPRVRAGARTEPFHLTERGRPEVAILWKNLIATSRLLSLRHLAILIAPAFILAAMSVQMGGENWTNFLHAAGALCLVFAGMLVLVGPGIIRSDLRMDLRMVDLLKSYPMKGRALVAGEVLAPVSVITLVQAFFLATAVPLMAGAAGWTAGDWAAAAIGAVILAGPLNLVTALVQNGVLLAFPSWHRLGQGRGRGIEAFGQVLIAGVLRLLVLALTLFPTALVLAVGIYFLYDRLGAMILPFLALAAAIPAVVEGWMGMEALGLFFERFDPSKEIDIPT